MLNSETLQLLSKDIKVPTYDRGKIKPGIFHFGVGGFHRAHQALVIDNLLEMDSLSGKGSMEEWGICGVADALHGNRMRNLIKNQNGLYTLVEKESSGVFSYRIIGSIVEHIFAMDGVNGVIERLTKPECRIVSLTITSAGYNINPATGEFDLDKVKDELKDPNSVFGIVIEALQRRKDRGSNGFTIVSCDNFSGNGNVAKKAFTAYAAAVDLDLALWMEKNVTFPNSMVDRITPATTEADGEAIYKKLGVVDKFPVVCEPAIQWVLEDNFVNDRPPFENSYVKLVNDVAPYEKMKLRLLNAGHQTITYFGLLMNYKLVHEAAGNKLIVRFLEAYMDEATSTLMNLDEKVVSDYRKEIIQRFKNSHIRDTLLRLVSKGFDRILRFVMPVIVDRLDEDQSILFSTAIVASFVYHQDRLGDLSTRLHNEKEIEEMFFGAAVKRKVFVETFKEIFEKIDKDGPEKTLRWLLEKRNEKHFDSFEPILLL